MSARIYIRCDRCHITSKVGFSTAKEARIGLARHGWTHPKRGIDLCGVCTTIVAEERKAELQAEAEASGLTVKQLRGYL